MQLQNFNFHTHTYRCKHAIKDEKDYIESAIANGFEVLGFSEHCGFDDFLNPIDRIEFDYMDDYFRDINIAKEKYKDKIKVYTGLEFEFFEDKIDYYKELKQKYDYMIVGQHYKNRTGYEYTYICTDKDVRYMAYQICSALEHGFAKYVAHPDYFMLARNDYSKECETAVREIVQTAKKVGAVLEINLKGMRYKQIPCKGQMSYKYPHTKTIEIYKEENADVVCGYDAHNPAVFYEREYETLIKEIIGDDVNYITDYKKILFDK